MHTLRELDVYSLSGPNVWARREEEKDQIVGEDNGKTQRPRQNQETRRNAGESVGISRRESGFEGEKI